MKRRDFVTTALSTLLFGACRQSLGPSVANAIATSKRKPVKVAAVQYNPVLGDVSANLQKAQGLVREAFAKNAKWVVLPEFFTSGNAMHEDIAKAHRPLNGEPMELLKRLAREGEAYVGGSFLAEGDTDIYNTFVLACPNGSTFTHDKDFPSTIYESSLYAGGEDAEYVRWLKEAGFDTKADTIPPRQGNNPRGCFGAGDFSVGVALWLGLVR